MAESVRRVYYRSDFDFIAKLMVADAGGEESELGFPAYDWRLFLKRTRGAPFMASSIGGVLTNCVNDGGRIRIICKNHDFVPGHLTGEMCCYIPNPIYPEGVQTVVSKHRLGIELVEDDADDATAIVAELQLPIVATGEGGIQDLSGYLTKIEAISLYQPKGDYATAGQLSAKQDALTPGDGISIEKNVISCTLDTSLYKVVVSLPESGEENKIYLVESNEQGEQNIYTEYGYINGKWETLGQYRAEVNLAPYLTKDDAARSYQPKGDYALREELPAVPTKVRELENDAEYVDADSMQQAIDGIDVGVKAVRLGNNDMGDDVSFINSIDYQYGYNMDEFTQLNDGDVYFSSVSAIDLSSGAPTAKRYIVGKVKGFNANSSSGKEILMMKSYLFDFSGTYTQAEIESTFKVTFDELITAIKNGNAIVITSSSDTSGNYNIVFGATYTLTDDGKTLSTLSMMWWQYGQWVTLSLTNNASSANYTVTVTKTA